MYHSRFQDFTEGGGPAGTAERVATLRAALAARRLDGVLVPRADEYQNEYVPPSDERLAWLSGFTGSAGIAVVLKDAAAIFVDGRYTVQVKSQVDPAVFAIENIAETAPADWLRRHLKPGMKLGFDPSLHTAEAVERYRAAAADAGAELVAAEPNPIDAIWRDRPAPPLKPVTLHEPRFAGEGAADKVARVQAELARAKSDAVILTDPHAVAWLFNIRGGDVSHTPLPLARAVVPASGRPTLLVDGRKLDNRVRATLADLADIAEPADLDREIGRLGAADAKVMLDPAGASFRLLARLEDAGATVLRRADPVAKLKAVKNAAEIAGARAAHRRDAVALCRFLAWVDREAATGKLTEIAAAETLEAFRDESGALKDLSFPTISAAGPNAALPHYRVSRDSNRVVEPGFLLVDSGAQYEDGTTDVTRTIVVGRPGAERLDRFTRVLQGHIAIATAIFPRGTSGAQIDAFARRPLWEAGTDFDHGTGHGVGSYLSVHEGPQRISKLGTVALEPGMIVSNEPGYYKEGAYGIRSENLVLVQEVALDGAERPMLGFETLTLAPFDRRGLAPMLMTAAERAWLDAYHARVLAEVGPSVDAETKGWLEAACAPIRE
ncbi:MAG TPA: aminopeptidase P family protein [Hyphomicrobiales bacterium]|nr:aminopeptidase P family protein [Hyphomicrobiales bacterium]